MSKNKKHNLLHVIGTLETGGAEMMLVHYSKALGNEHYRHFVYCFGADGLTRPLLEKLGVTVVFGPKVESIKNPFKFILSLLFLFKNISQFIKENTIHTIHSHSDQSDKVAVFVGKLTRVPAFPTIHNTKFTVDRRSKLDPRVYLIKTVDHIIYRIADRLIAISDEVNEVICNRYSLEKSKVITVKNGIIFEPVSSKNTKKNSGDSSHKGKLKLFAVGRLTYQKNFEVLIKATEYLLKMGCKNIHVQIAGTGEEYEFLSDLIRDRNLGLYVELLGGRSDVLALMQESDLFIMPSRYEGLSIAMIEALACGLPVIASNAPGLRDYIHHGENGMLFPVGDGQALADCILKFANDRNLQDNLAYGATESFKKNYNMLTNIEPLCQLLDKYKG